MSKDRGNLLHYIAKACERPLMIMPEKLAVIAGVLGGRIGVDASDLQRLVDEKMLAYVTKPAPDANAFEGEDAPVDPTKPYGAVKPYRVSGRTAIIAVQGSLVNRGAWIGSYSGMTSYEGIRHQLGCAKNDADIDSVILDVDSPGGEAIGAFETGVEVSALNKVKPVVAYVNGLACSAAYAIACRAGRIVVSPTSVVGSIGVVMLHMDQSKYMREIGVKPTFIYAGEHKVDANPFEPLSDDVKKALQADVDTLYTLFVDHVAAGRKGLSADAIRATEADTYFGTEAVEKKLADAVGTFEATLTGLKGRSNTKGNRMENEIPAAVAAVEAPAVAAVVEAPAAAAAPAAEAPKADAAAIEAARAEGASAERARINAIVSLPEAQGRESAAMHMAMTTSMTAEQVKPVLAGLPAAAPAKKAAATGLGLVVSGTVPAPAAASGWDGALKRAGASLPEQKKR